MVEGKYQEFIGRTTGRSTVTLERGPVANFARAVKDENPIYQRTDAARDAGFDGIPAPPTFLFAAGQWGAFPENQPPDDPAAQGNPIGEILGALMSEGGLVLHGEQEFEYHRPLTAGMRLTHEGTVTDVYEKESKGRTMTFVVTENEYRDDAGDLVAVSRMNLIHRS